MKGLIVKDFLVILSKLKPLPIVILLILSCVALFYFGSTGVLLINVFYVIYFCALPIPIFQEDDKVGWNTYILASPMTKKEIVASRYIACFSLIAVVSVIMLALNFLYSFISDFSLTIHIFTVFISLVVGFLYLSLLIPSIYYAGSNGSSTVMLIVILLTSIVTFLSNSKVIDFQVLFTISPFVLISVMLLLICLAIYVSFVGAVKVFTRTNFK